MHYYTFDLGDDGQDEPLQVLRSCLSEGGPRFEILQPGQAINA
jgi:hypothetical protein